MRCALLILAFLLLTESRAAAHALGAECKLASDKVEVEAYFDDDTEAAEAKVQVEAGNKAIVAEGRTDKSGRWSFARPQPGRYLVIVDAGAGHRTKVDITIPGQGNSGTSSAAPDHSGQDGTISHGPDRREFTRLPWLKVAIGLSVIGALGLAFIVSRRLRPAGASTRP